MGDAQKSDANKSYSMKSGTGKYIIIGAIALYALYNLSGSSSKSQSEQPTKDQLYPGSVACTKTNNSRKTCSSWNLFCSRFPNSPKCTQSKIYFHNLTPPRREAGYCDKHPTDFKCDPMGFCNTHRNDRLCRYPGSHWCVGRDLNKHHSCRSWRGYCKRVPDSIWCMPDAKRPGEIEKPPDTHHTPVSQGQ